MKKLTHTPPPQLPEGISIRQAPSAETIKFLTDALLTGELTFKRTSVYRKQYAPMGFVYYKIRYISGQTDVYNGAYRMDLKIERQLLQTTGNLEKYLINKLAPELINP